MGGLTIEMFLSYGIFGGLFGFLFINTMKKNDEREKRYEEREKEIERKNDEREQRYLAIIDNFTMSINANTAVISRLADDLESRQ